MKIFDKKKSNCNQRNTEAIKVKSVVINAIFRIKTTLSEGINKIKKEPIIGSIIKEDKYIKCIFK